MKMLAWAALRLSALFTCAIAAPAMAATVPMPQCMNAGGASVPCTGAVPIDPATGNPLAPGELAGTTSSPLEADVTPTGATSTSGSASFANGAALLGPMTPQLGRDLRIIIRSTTTGSNWAGTVAIGTSTNSCATINPLTVGGATWASYTANANEVFDTPTLAGVQYCATATITSGSAHIAVRQ